jgi:hypothetical protein
MKKANARGVGTSITETVYNTDEYGNLQIVVIPRPGVENSIQQEINRLRNELKEAIAEADPGQEVNLYVKQLITISASPNQIYSTASLGNGSPLLQSLNTAKEFSILGRGTRGNIKIGTNPTLVEPYQLRPVGFLQVYKEPINTEMYFSYIPINNTITAPIIIELYFTFKAP